MPPRTETGPHLRLPYEVESLSDQTPTHIQEVQNALPNLQTSDVFTIRADVDAYLPRLEERINAGSTRRDTLLAVKTALEGLRTALDQRLFQASNTVAQTVAPVIGAPAANGVEGYGRMLQSTSQGIREGRWGHALATGGILATVGLLGGAAISKFWQAGEPAEGEEVHSGFLGWRTAGRALWRATKAILITAGTLGTGWLLLKYHRDWGGNNLLRGNDDRTQQMNTTTALASLPTPVALLDARLAQADLFALPNGISVGSNVVTFMRTSGTTGTPATMQMIVNGAAGRFSTTITDAAGAPGGGLTLNGMTIAPAELIRVLGGTTALGTAELNTANGRKLTLAFQNAGL